MKNQADSDNRLISKITIDLRILKNRMRESYE